MAINNLCQKCLSHSNSPLLKLEGLFLELFTANCVAGARILNVLLRGLLDVRNLDLVGSGYVVKLRLELGNCLTEHGDLLVLLSALELKV